LDRPVSFRKVPSTATVNPRLGFPDRFALEPRRGPGHRSHASAKAEHGTNASEQKGGHSSEEEKDSLIERRRAASYGNDRQQIK